MGERITGTGVVQALGHPTGVSLVGTCAGTCRRMSPWHLLQADTLMHSACAASPVLPASFVHHAHRPAMLQYEVDLALGAIIGALFLGGLAPTRFIYSSVKDEQPRPLFDDVPALLGRLSCIGLGATILAEAVTGKVCT